jgi:flagellar hook-length control protein FliK
MKSLAASRVAETPPRCDWDESSRRGSELAAGLFELVAREVMAPPAARAPRACDAADADRGSSARGADAAARNAHEDAVALPWWLRGPASGDLATSAAEVARESRQATPLALPGDTQAGTAGENGFATQLSAEPPSAASAERQGAAAVDFVMSGVSPAPSEAMPDDPLQSGLLGLDSENVLFVRGEERAGDAGPLALTGAAGHAAGSGGATGGSREPRIERPTDWAAPRPTSPPAAQSVSRSESGVQSGLDGNSSGAGGAKSDGMSPGTDTSTATLAAGAAFASPWPEVSEITTPFGSLRATVRVQTVRALRAAVLAESQNAVVTLDPPGLGRIRIQVRVVADLVAASVRAERPEVERLLRADRQVIRSRLAEQGLRLETLLVERGARGGESALSSQNDTRTSAGFDASDGERRESSPTGQELSDRAAGQRTASAEGEPGATATGGDSEGPATAERAWIDPWRAVDVRI